jgi:class 3 adenylate cyclase
VGGDRRPARPHGGVYGEAEERDDDYFGQTLNRVARLLSAGHGNQILLSETTEQLVRAALPDKTYLRDRGKHRLKDSAGRSMSINLSRRTCPGAGSRDPLR